MKADKLFEVWFELKERRKKLDEDYKEKKAKIDEAQQKVRECFDKIMAEVGTDQVAIKGVGVAFPEIKQKVQCSDAAALRGFIAEQINSGNDEAINLLNAAANQAACKAWLEEEGQLPEGVEIHQVREIVIRKK